MTNYYTNIKGERVKYDMNSDLDLPEERRKVNIDIDRSSHQCSMYECKFIFSGCNRVYKKSIGDKRRCIKYKR